VASAPFESAEACSKIWAGTCSTLWTRGPTGGEPSVVRAPWPSSLTPAVTVSTVLVTPEDGPPRSGPGRPLKAWSRVVPRESSPDPGGLGPGGLDPLPGRAP